MYEAPEKPDRPVGTEHQYRDEIRTDKESSIVETLNWAWATTGARGGPWVWPEGSPWSTKSTSSTQVNDNAGADLDQISPIITPRRSELGALAAAPGDGPYIVELQVYAVDVVVDFTLFRRPEDDVTWTATATASVTFGTTPQWRSVYVLVEDTASFGYGEHLIELHGAYAQGGTESGDIYQVQPLEIRHSNLPHSELSSLELYGSEWVGMYGGGVVVESWDDDGAQSALDRVSGAPLMRRDEVTQDVHAVEFAAGPDLFETSNAVDLSGAAGFIVACAMARDADQAMVAIGKSSANISEGFSLLFGFNGSNGLVQIVTSAGSHSAAADGGAVGTWNDWLAWWDSDDKKLRLFRDLEQVSVVNTGTTLADDETAFQLGALNGRLYPFDGKAAMPLFLEGGFTRHQVEHLMQWRRSIHGLY